MPNKQRQGLDAAELDELDAIMTQLHDRVVPTGELGMYREMIETVVRALLEKYEPDAVVGFMQMIVGDVVGEDQRNRQPRP